LSYFNYFTEIEDAFVRRRGKHLFLSPLDWALMETWKQQDVPLHIVLRGIERSFDSYESKPRKRSVKSLRYCQVEVEAQYAEWLEARVGANESTEVTSPESETKFSFTSVSEHLDRCRSSLTELLKRRREQGEDNLTEALERAIDILDEIKADFDPATFDSRRLEDSLTGLERLLHDALQSVIPPERLKEIKSDLAKQLKPIRGHMDNAAYEQTLNNFLMKRLGQEFEIPRLSLFYL
jgi:hypothetical protein